MECKCCYDYVPRVLYIHLASSIVTKLPLAIMLSYRTVCYVHIYGLSRPLMTIGQSSPWCLTNNKIGTRSSDIYWNYELHRIGYVRWWHYYVTCR